jgi:hypothetical protein
MAGGMVECKEIISFIWVKGIIWLCCDRASFSIPYLITLFHPRPPNFHRRTSAALPPRPQRHNLASIARAFGLGVPAGFPELPVPAA